MGNPQNKRLTGLNPLAYMGVEPITPPLMVIDNRAPTSTDYDNFNLASFWLDSVSEALYLLVNKDAGVATWIQLSSSSGSVIGLLADNAVTAFPVAGIIDLAGGSNISTSASGSTVTFDFSGVLPIANGGTNANSFGTTDGTVYFDGTSLVTTTTGTSGQVLTSNGVGVAPSYQSASFTSLTFDGDSGSAHPAAGIITIAGGTGMSTSASGSTVTINLSSPVSIAHGGTNATSFATTDGTVYYDGTRLVTTATGTSGQVLTSNGAGVAPTYQTFSGSFAVKTTTFNTSGTWTPDARTSWVVAYGWGGGAGGGGGRQGASTAAGGGGGGAGSSTWYISSPIVLFNPAGETVTIGAAGLGGATQASANTNGNAGSTCTLSYLGKISQGLQAGFGVPAAGGTTTLANGGGNTIGLVIIGGVAQTNSGNSGQGSNVDASNNSADIFATSVSSSGGGGGGADTGTARSGSDAGNIFTPDNLSIEVAAGAGGIETGTINGGNGNNAPTSLTGGVIFGATGGGGGGGQKSGLVAGNGGIGGFPGGGGGGGGGSINGTTSGAGGNGGAGLVLVFEFMS